VGPSQGALLHHDESSRRAVLLFNGPDDHLNPMARDIPCACTLQFLIRDGCLEAIAYMRSNDAILGLPYDVFLFTMLQELLACELGISLGVYHHIAGSLHLYERHLKFGRRIVEAGLGSEFEMPPMESQGDIASFLHYEDLIRVGVVQNTYEFLDINPFWRDLLKVLLSFRKLTRSKTLELADSSPVDQHFIYETFIRLVA
jgi:thymidylate synthase